MTDDDKNSGKKPKVDPLRRERLEAHLASLKSLVGFRKDLAAKDKREPWATHAAKSLEEAEAALTGDDLEKAWSHTHQCFRFLYHSMNAAELVQRARVLRREAEDKLGNWRKEAVLDVLGRDHDPKRNFKADDLVLAQFLLDTHFANVYFKIETLTPRIGMLSGMLVVLGVAVLVVSLILDTSGAEGNSFLFSYEKTVLVALLGAVGAMLTHALSSLSMTDRIPQVLRRAQGWFIRLAVGALSAVAVCLIIESGILPIKAPEGGALYAYAVLAGLSDRILDRVVRAAEKSLEK